MDRAIRLASLVCRERFSCAQAGRLQPVNRSRFLRRKAIQNVTDPLQLGDHLVQSTTLDQLHRIVADLCVLPDLEDRHNIGVMQLGRGEPRGGTARRPNCPPRAAARPSAIRRPSDNCSAS